MDLPLAALTADLRLLPYQLEPLFALRDGYRRLLVADGVGLGKTIQAGLIVAELLRRREAARVLIAVPGHLCRQWHEELRGRFNLSPRLADADALAELAARLPRALNPWSVDAVWIGSLDFLKQPHILRSLPPDPWDLVVIDEAHMITGHSQRRAAARALTLSSRRVVLLTATPPTGAADWRALAHLGALDAREPLTVFHRTRADVGIHGVRRLRSVYITPSAAERQALDLVDEFTRAAVAAAGPVTVDATHLLVSVLAKRALSSFGALALSVDRRLAHLAGLPVTHADTAQQVFDFDDTDEEALTGTIGMTRDRERSWMRRLRAAAVAAAATSHKVARLLTLLARTREPAIIFTEFRDSLELIATALRRHRHDVAIAHGGVTSTELHAALDAFRRGDARLLLTTDVASQGLNLHQQARWVIHFDLPWNPIRLEQRAGRVDRLGQGRDVHVTRLVLTHARDLAFAERLAVRAEASQREMAQTSTARWQRRARAAAVVLEQRRYWAGAWRGPVNHGRPLARRANGAPAEIREIDIDGEETLVMATDVGGCLPGRVAARARRVARTLAARASRDAVVERALSARLGAAETQPPLPGAFSADAARQTARDSAAIAAARARCDERIARLDAAATSHARLITERVRFLSR